MSETAGQVSATHFPRASWTGPCLPDRFGAEGRPYPGPRPAGSFLIQDALVYGVEPARGPGWRRRDCGEQVQLSGRELVLAYGSNGDPRKLALRFPSDVTVALRCAIVDHAAVWCAARRRNGDVVATLIEAPGHIEVHAVLALTPAQLETMDAWEGTPRVYERRPIQGSVVLEDGTRPATVYAYIGAPARRPPLQRAGRPFLVSEHRYETINALVPRHESHRSFS